MDERERIARVATIKQEAELTLENRVKALEKLTADYPTIDLDVLTDVHPELLDGRSVEGQEQLDFWRNLYESLDQHPLSTATVRFAEGPESGVCTGFGYEPKTELKEVWLRIYENLSAADILFVKGNELNESSKIVIAAPSVLISHNKDLEYINEPTVLFDEKPPVPGVWSGVESELYSDPLPRVIHATTPEEKLFIVEDAQGTINHNRQAVYPFFIERGANYNAWHESMLQNLRNSMPSQA